MNNGLYVGPIISRKSPRWRVQEFTNVDTGSGLITAVHEPYIPPSVAAVMITATAPTSPSGAASSGASCHSIVWPVKDRRLFLEFAGSASVRLFLMDEPAIANATVGQLSSAAAEHSLILFGNASSSTAFAYSRNASQYLSVSQGQASPYFNGVIAGGAATTQAMSLIDPRLRQSGTGGATLLPGNLFSPMRASTSTSFATAGTSLTTAGSHRAPGYVRVEYLV